MGLLNLALTCPRTVLDRARKPFFGYTVPSILLCTLLFGMVPGMARAECLGLGMPAPQQTNVCETLVENLVVPAHTELFCDIDTWELAFLPWCAAPGACFVDPTCITFQQTKEIAETIYYAGDLYCDFREVDPEEMIEKLGNGLYTDTVKLTTGGTSSILFNVAEAHIDTLSCSADYLSSNLKDVIDHIAVESPWPRDEYFYNVDLDRATIIDRSAPLADIYLREGYGAITLDSLIIFRDTAYLALSSWSHTWDEVKFGQLTVAEEQAMISLIHELVHVRQYRQMGEEQFINSYLTEALQNDYPSISMEQQAYSFQSWASKEYERQRGIWDAVTTVIL